MADLNKKFLDYGGLSIFLSKLQEYIADRITEINGSNVNAFAKDSDNPLHLTDPNKYKTISSQLQALWEAIGVGGDGDLSITDKIENIIGEYVKSINEPTSQTLPLKIQITEGTGDDNKGRFTIGLVDNGLNDTLSTLTDARVSKITPKDDGGAVTLSINKNTGEVEITVNSKELTERVSALESNRIKSVTKGTSTENYLTLGVSTAGLNTTITIDDTELKEKISSMDAEMDTFAKSESIPTKLPNPNSLTVKWKDTSNTTQSKSYDGVDTTEVDLTGGVYHSETSTNSTNATNAEFIGSNSNNVGGSHQPVYISGGKPTAITIDGGTSDTENCLLTEAKNSPNQIWSTTGITANYSKKTLTAEGGFIGDLQGNAATSTKSSDSDKLGGQLPSHYATKSELNSTNENIQSIQDSYVKSIKASNASTKSKKYVTIAPTDTTTGEATITINDSDLTEKIESIDSAMKLKAEKTEIPTKLPNPNSITVKWKDTSNTTQTKTHDGSDATTADLTGGVYYAKTSTDATNAVNATNATNAVNAQHSVNSDKLGNVEASQYATKTYVGETLKPISEKIEDIDNYTVNGKRISTNPVLSAEDVKVGIGIDEVIKADTKLSKTIDEIVNRITALGKVVNLTGVYTKWEDYTGTPENGDFIIVGNKEYVYWNGWIELGDTTQVTQYLNDLINKYNSHTHSFTPTGTVTSTFTGSECTTKSISGTTTASSITSVGSLPTTAEKEVATKDHTHATSITAKGTVTSTFNGEQNTTSSNGLTISYAAGKLTIKSAHTHTMTPTGTIESTFTGQAVSGTSGAPSTTLKFDAVASVGSLPTYSTVNVATSTHTHNIIPTGTVTSTFNGGGGTSGPTGSTQSLPPIEPGAPDSFNPGGGEGAMDYSKEYFTLHALGDGDIALYMPSSYTTAPSYSLNGGEWTTFTEDDTILSLKSGDKVRVKCVTDCYMSDGYVFSSTCDYEVYGNVMSLLYGDDFEGQTDLTGTYGAFGFLFAYSDTLKSAKNLILPATTLADYCYNGMFNYCINLTEAPVELPATTLAYDCYGDMFAGCTSLTTAPALPATTLVDECYSNMFEGCTSLTTAPALPATILAYSCYSNMFEGCTSLTTAPQLPAITLFDCCYSYMFEGCTSLTTAPQLPATTLADECYSHMFEGCTSLITAPALSATTLASNCYQYMFSGCSSLTTAPQLPATTLTSSTDECYSYMFSNCVNLTTAPQLPATTLSYDCYGGMFEGCTSLTTAPQLPATTLSLYCYRSMFEGCTSLTTAPQLPATTLVSGCYDRMFYGCSGLTTAPQLPATTLASNCYRYMFSGCSSLTIAPQLPATILASSCYERMFESCTNLTTAPELPATILASSCYDRMFSNCSSLTTAPQLPATTLAVCCYSHMFSSCTSLTSVPTNLPATTLDVECYSYMFSNCVNLTTAPLLPATTLDEECYYRMFSGCSKLNYIKMIATDISASKCLSNWVSGVASTGTFIKDANMTSLPTGTNGIPSGWTVQDYQDGGNDTITFTIEGTEYQAEEGMTWEEWVNSEYNIDGFYCVGLGDTPITSPDGTKSVYDVGEGVIFKSQLIIPNHEYILFLNNYN